jgi:hypothetical protein
MVHPCLFRPPRELGAGVPPPATARISLDTAPVPSAAQTNHILLQPDILVAVVTSKSTTSASHLRPPLFALMQALQ